MFNSRTDLSFDVTIEVELNFGNKKYVYFRFVTFRHDTQ